MTLQDLLHLTVKLLFKLVGLTLLLFLISVGGLLSLVLVTPQDYSEQKSDQLLCRKVGWNLGTQAPKQFPDVPSCEVDTIEAQGLKQGACLA